MSGAQIKMAGAILLVAAMLVATVVVPQRANAQAGSNVKGDKQKIIVDEEPSSASKQKNSAKADCEKNHMKWDDTAKKCSK
jgi:hypothetical protein